MSFDTAETIAQRLSATPPPDMPLKGNHVFHRSTKSLDEEEGDAELLSEEGNKFNEIWRQPEIILKAKAIVFAEKSKLHGLVEPLFNSFIHEKFNVETISEALDKVRDPDLGENVTKDVLVSDFLHYLKDNDRWDIVGRIEKAKEQTKVDEVGFHIGLNRQSLERKANSRDKVAVEEVWKNWAKVENLDGSQIEAVGFGVEGKKISNVMMKLKDGSSIIIPAPVFRSVFDGVRPYHDKISGDVTGFEFKNLNSEVGYIHPKTPQDKLDVVMKKMHMNGTPLPESVRFFITSYEERIPVVFPWKKLQPVAAEV